MGLKKRPDLVLALFCSMAFFAVSAVAYSALARAQQGAPADALNLPLGESLFFLRSGASCVARFSFSASGPQGELRLESQGAINVQLGDQKLSVPLTFSAFFNSLGQLGASILRVKSAQGDIVIGTKGVDPITLVLRSDLPGKERRFEVMLPGPITAKAHRQELKITLPGATRLRARNEQPLMTALLQSFDLGLVDNAISPQFCEPNSLAYLQLGPLKNLLDMMMLNAPALKP